jgi:hypothetical protein
MKKNPEFSDMNFDVQGEKIPSFRVLIAGEYYTYSLTVRHFWWESFFSLVQNVDIWCFLQKLAQFSELHSPVLISWKREQGASRLTASDNVFSELV